MEFVLAVGILPIIAINWMEILYVNKEDSLSMCVSVCVCVCACVWCGSHGTCRKQWKRLIFTKGEYYSKKINNLAIIL